MRKNISYRFLAFITALLLCAQNFAHAAETEAYAATIDTQSQVAPLVKFLSQNLTPDGMPLSYKVPDGYWKEINHPTHEVDAVIERLLTTNSLNIYDGALWQIVQALSGNLTQASSRTDSLLGNSSGNLFNIRAWNDFTYSGKQMTVNSAYFFRMLSDRYTQIDPLDGKKSLQGFPIWAELHHEDWKPVTGENAWGAIIGPLQLAYVRYQGQIPLDSDEVKLAVSIFPSIEALQSPIGAIYYAPEGTYGVEATYISVENNISMLAALRMLAQVLEKGNAEDKVKIEKAIIGIENFLADYAYDKKSGIFYQGGHFKRNQWVPTKEFAVDCQTWSLAVLGGEWIDKRFGEGASFKIWEITKERAAYFDAQHPKDILGFGYTDGHDVLSGEWSYGAILAAKNLASFYKSAHPEFAASLEMDILSIRRGVESLRVNSEDGSASYKYSNKRHYVVFGWWANPIPSTASTAWAYFDKTEFNPFILGGGDSFTPIKDA